MGNPVSSLSEITFQIKHYVIQRTANGKYTVEKYGFDSVPDMINFHLTKRESLVKQATVLLTTPVPRQIWELHHEDIEPTKKLGEGAFGEVHRGHLRLKNGRQVDVAIKLVSLFACIL